MGPDIVFLLFLFGDDAMFILDMATWAEVAASPLNCDVTFSRIWGSNNSSEKGEEEARRFLYDFDIDGGRRRR